MAHQHGAIYSARKRFQVLMKIGDMSRHGQGLTGTASLERLVHAKGIRELTSHGRHGAGGAGTAVEQDDQWSRLPVPSHL